MADIGMNDLKKGQKIQFLAIFGDFGPKWPQNAFFFQL